jgi:hypothetical protein
MSPGPIPPTPAGEERDSGERTMGVGSTVPTSTDSISRDLDISKEKFWLQVLYPRAASFRDVLIGRCAPF